MQLVNSNGRHVPMLIAAAALTFNAQGGPEWVEVDDAGSTPSSSQIASGTGPLLKIRGKLEGPAAFNSGVDDFEDMYLVHIAPPADFCMVMITAKGLPPDTRLWLFNVDGTGLLANDDVPPLVMPPCTGADIPVPPSPYLLAEANDGSGAMIVAPGDYYIAISSQDRHPESVTGPIFFFATNTEISGPDGPGQLDPIVTWIGPGQRVGDYNFDVEAMEFPLPPAGTGACCLPLGECLVTTPTQCAKSGGTFLGEGVPCSAGLCQPSVGACCIGGGCTIATPDACASAGGSFQGLGSDCGPDTCAPPPPSGACCIGGECSILTAVSCASQGGAYQGDDTSCEIGACAPLGACCLSIQCLILTELECDTLKGTYLGDKTQCDAFNCCIAIGLICEGDVTGNGVVDVDDLLMVITNWGPCK